MLYKTSRYNQLTKKWDIQDLISSLLLKRNQKSFTDKIKKISKKNQMKKF